MSGPKRVHIQFSGSLQPEDAERIVNMLVEAIGRRPKECGAILEVREFGSEAPIQPDEPAP